MSERELAERKARTLIETIERTYDWLKKRGFEGIAEHAISREDFLEGARVLADGNLMEDEWHEALDEMLALLVGDRDVALAWDAPPKWYA